MLINIPSALSQKNNILLLYMITVFKYDYIDFITPLIKQAKEYQALKLVGEDDLLMDNIDNVRTFNTSIAKIDENTYLYAVRIIAKVYKKEPPIPGNNPNCQQKISPGSNYWWNFWKGPREQLPQSYTVFFIGNHINNDLTLCMCDNCDHDISNLCNGFYIGTDSTINFLGDDIRIFNINKDIYLQTRDLNHIDKINIDIDKKSIKINHIITNIFRLEDYAMNLIIDMIESQEQYIITYVDWFYYNGVKIVKESISKKKVTDGVTKEVFTDFIIPYDKYKLIGTGSYDNKSDTDQKNYGTNYGKIPGLSFTTPHILVNNKYYLGVGHSKIHSDVKTYPYVKNSKIDNFRNKLYQSYKNRFGDKYIQHLGLGRPDPKDGKGCYGYIYMMFFYIIDKDSLENVQNPQDASIIMKMSDSFLPLYLGTDQDYKFSLVYPMGIVQKGDRIIVTAGEGDFYSVAYEFNTNEVINLCKYDVKNVNMDDYNYYIIEYNNEHSFKVVTDIGANISIQTGGNINYKHKYLKYKSKYLDLKSLKYAN